MTTELTISIMNMGRGDEKLRAALAAFEEQHDVRVNLVFLEWTEGWPELSRYVAAEKGPDISEIGSTWLPSLVSMNALVPFSLPELSALGGEEIFFPRAWQGVVWKDRAYAMPWFCDARLLFYRQDLLQKANISPERAFSSPDSFYETLETLHKAGIPNLWAIPTWRHANNVHLISSWIWGYGGDFMSADGKKLVLDQPAALHGITRYFETTRFMSGERVAGTTDPDLVERFIQGQTAILPSGPWVVTGDIQRATSEVRQGWNLTSLPGGSFVGGSHLVVWRYSRKRDLAIKLLSYLASEKAQADLYAERHMLPANQKALQAQKDLEHIDEIVNVLKTGRTFPNLSVWSRIEERLVAELNGIWADVLAMPAEDISYEAVREIVDVRITSAVRRLNLAISA